MRHHRIDSRPHVQAGSQGTAAPLRLRHSANDLTDGAGLLLVRQLWDRLRLGERIAHHAPQVGGRFQSPLMIESWLALLLYGGGAMDDLKWLAGRGVRHAMVAVNHAGKSQAMFIGGQQSTSFSSPSPLKHVDFFEADGERVWDRTTGVDIRPDWLNDDL